MLKVGLLGFGNIGRKHQQAIDLLDDYTLSGYYDVKPQEEILLKRYDSVDQLLQQDDIDIITVCTPNSYHKEHAIQVLESGKHVICEKPFALKKKDCEEVINKSLSSGKYIFCVMQNRFSPASQWLKSILSDNLIGDILLVNVACYWNRDDRYYKKGNWKGSSDIDGGTLFTQFAHYIDTLYYLLGELNIKSGQFANFTHDGLIDFEDSGNFSFETKQKAIGNFQYSTSAWNKNFESSITIVGARGTVKIAGQYMDKVIYAHGEKLPNEIKLPDNDNIKNLSKIYMNASEVLKGKADIMTSAMDGMKVVELIETIYSFKG